MFFEAGRKEVLFLEHVSALDLKRNRHFAIEVCLPLRPNLARRRRSKSCAPAPPNRIAARLACQRDKLPCVALINTCPSLRPQCVPVPRAAAEQAPGYYKKAILEADEEWAMHETARCIDTRGRGIRKVRPTQRDSLTRCASALRSSLADFLAEFSLISAAACDSSPPAPSDSAALTR